MDFEEMTDEEVARCYRNRRSQTHEAYKELVKRGYSLKARGHDLVLNEEIVVIAKNIRKEI